MQSIRVIQGGNAPPPPRDPALATAAHSIGDEGNMPPVLLAVPHVRQLVFSGTNDDAKDTNAVPTCARFRRDAVTGRLSAVLVPWDLQLEVVSWRRQHAEFIAACKLQRAWRSYLAHTSDARQLRLAQSKTLFTFGRHCGIVRRRDLLVKLDKLYYQQAMNWAERVRLGRSIFCGNARLADERIGKLVGDVAKRRRRTMALTRRWENQRSVRKISQAIFIDTLRLQLQWEEEQIRRFASFWHAATSVVGLRRVHGFLHERIADAVGRFQLKETPHHRHILVEGDFGTGKHTAAELIARLYQVQHPSASLCARK